LTRSGEETPPYLTSSQPFRVGVTADLARLWDATGLSHGRAQLDQAKGVTWEILPDVSELPPSCSGEFDGLLLLKPRVSSRTLSGGDRLRVIARWGVGVDNIDVDACTRHGVVVTIAPDGVRRPMAVAMLTFILALSTNLIHKHDAVRRGEWDRAAYLGVGITDRVIGMVGYGNIARDFVKLARPLGAQLIAADPYVAPDSMDDDVALVDLATVAKESDFLCISCPLTAETENLIDADAIALMKRTSFLINVSRGPIVDEAALIDALSRERIAGAGLDVFALEPLDPQSPLRSLPNVVAAPHSLGWTDELVAGNDRSAVSALLAVAAGKTPPHVLNPSALAHPRQGAWTPRRDEGETG
jgi:phosphoglycerate dehydrogenase-like enzyme